METFTANGFKSLTKTEQVIKLVSEGEKLMERVWKGYDIHLYTLSNLFVELWYESNTRKIVRVEITDSDSMIKNYKDIGVLEID